MTDAGVAVRPEGLEARAPGVPERGARRPASPS